MFKRQMQQLTEDEIGGQLVQLSEDKVRVIIDREFMACSSPPIAIKIIN